MDHTPTLARQACQPATFVALIEVMAASLSERARRECACTCHVISFTPIRNTLLTEF